MATTSAPTHEELKEYLKEAGLYEESLSYDELLNFYNVIKNSKNTAQEEQDRRDITDSVESNTDDDKGADLDTSDIHFDDDYTPDGNSRKSTVGESSKLIKKPGTSKNKSKLSLTKLSPQLKTNLDKEEEVDSNILSPDNENKPLDIIFYERKYELPPYCNPKYNKLSISQRAKVICNFHKVVLGTFYKLHCESINPAPWGRPVAVNDRSGISDRKSQSADNSFEFVQLNEEENSNNLQIYTSRSGRQTKRKVYIDDVEDENDSKKTKKSEDKLYEAEKKSITKRQNLSKLNNQDIIKRSKLFSEPPKPTKAEKLFDQLKKDEKSSVTDAVETVTDVIKSSNDDDDIIPSSQSSDVEIEATVIRRRIVPPRARRGIGPRKFKGSDITRSSRNTSPLASTSNPSNSQSPAASTTENKKTLVVGRTKCPICSQLFSQDDIETHASSCGLLVETETTLDTSLRNGNATKIKCSICDTELIMNTDYEVHVKECIKKSKQSENP